MEELERTENVREVIRQEKARDKDSKNLRVTISRKKMIGSRL